MIDESELAKTIRGKEDLDVLIRSRNCLSQLQNILAPIHDDMDSPAPEEVIRKASSVVEELVEVVQTTMEPERLEELLGINDQLAGLIAKVRESRLKPTLRLEGLGLGLPVSTGGEVMEDDGLSTPRSSDKGKHRADPEPIEHDKVLTPTSAFLIDDHEEDEEEYGFPAVAEDPEEDESEQTTRSKSWVEEEGEVFRKGNALLGPDELEGEYAGEELRRELLDAMVERPPPRPLDLDDPLADPAAEPEATPPGSALSETPAPRPYLPRTRSSSSSLNGSPSSTPPSSILEAPRH